MSKTVKRIYCAGKVNPDGDWREAIIPFGDLFQSSNDLWLSCRYQLDTGREFIYTGPYLIYGKPHDYFGQSHGSPYQTSSDLLANCLEAIKESDTVFAWINSLTAYGTLAEIGYAKALGKTIWIAGPDLSDRDEADFECNDLWFVHELADELLIGRPDIQPLDALKTFLKYQFESPIEQMFWDAWKRYQKLVCKDLLLTPQYPIGRYRIDFAYEPAKIAIELDGHATHSSPSAIAYDRKRQREIESQGWKVIRYGGKEITSDAYQCALEAHKLISLCVKHNTSSRHMEDSPSQL